MIGVLSICYCMSKMYPGPPLSSPPPFVCSPSVILFLFPCLFLSSHSIPSPSLLFPSFPAYSYFLSINSNSYCLAFSFSHYSFPMLSIPPFSP